MNKKQQLRVRDIMNPDVETLLANQNVQNAAKLMREKEVGSVVIVDQDDQQKPIGIITERDINNRVVAENKLPSEVICKEIMSKPVLSISPNIMLIDAMHRLATQHIKRLIVMEEQKMIAIISQSDILEIAPFLIEILQEMANIRTGNYKAEFLAGYCQLCETWSDTLIEIDELYICPECKAAKHSPDF